MCSEFQCDGLDDLPAVPTLASLGAGAGAGDDNEGSEDDDVLQYGDKIQRFGGKLKFVCSQLETVVAKGQKLPFGERVEIDVNFTDFDTALSFLKHLKSFPGKMGQVDLSFVLSNDKIDLPKQGKEAPRGRAPSSVDFSDLPELESVFGGPGGAAGEGPNSLSASLILGAPSGQATVPPAASATPPTAPFPVGSDADAPPVRELRDIAPAPLHVRTKSPIAEADYEGGSNDSDSEGSEW
jgi:hypothetical protein